MRRPNLTLYRERRVQRRKQRAATGASLVTARVLRMRTSTDSDREVWARYVKAGREAIGLPQTTFARRVGVGRATAYRWETAQQRPEDPQTVAAVAAVFGDDPEKALAAAGLSLVGESPDRPGAQELPLDPRLKLILDRLADPTVSEDEKRLIRSMLDNLAELAERSGVRQPNET